jgi:hypothetical protein
MYKFILINETHYLFLPSDLLAEEVDPSVDLLTASPQFRKHLTQALLYKVFHKKAQL